MKASQAENAFGYTMFRFSHDSLSTELREKIKGCIVKEL